MKKVKAIFIINPVRSMAVLIGIVMAIIVYPAFVLETGNTHEFSMHLFVELLILSATVLLIQPILDEQKESQWKTGKESGDKELNLLVNMASTYMVSPLDITVFDYTHIHE